MGGIAYSEGAFASNCPAAMKMAESCRPADCAYLGEPAIIFATQVEAGPCPPAPVLITCDASTETGPHGVSAADTSLPPTLEKPCRLPLAGPLLPPATAAAMSRHDGRNAHYFGVSCITVLLPRLVQKTLVVSTAIPWREPPCPEARVVGVPPPIGTDITVPVPEFVQ